ARSAHGERHGRIAALGQPPGDEEADVPGPGGGHRHGLVHLPQLAREDRLAGVDGAERAPRRREERQRRRRARERPRPGVAPRVEGGAGDVEREARRDGDDDERRGERLGDEPAEVEVRGDRDHRDRGDGEEPPRERVVEPEGEGGGGFVGGHGEACNTPGERRRRRVAGRFLDGDPISHMTISWPACSSSTTGRTSPAPPSGGPDGRSSTATASRRWSASRPRRWTSSLRTLRTTSRTGARPAAA